MNSEYEHYTMDVQWSDEDTVYIVTVPEFPGCRTHGETYEEAVKNGQEVIELLIDTMRASGRTIPAPKVLVRQ